MKKGQLGFYRIIDEKRLTNCLEFIASQFIERQDKPFTVEIKEYDPKRTPPQSDLQFVWYEIAEKYGKDGWRKDDYRAFCKLHFGLPIMYEVSEEYREKVKPIIDSLPYERQLDCMLEPMRIAVTSLMTKGQMTEYLDKVYNFLTMDCGIDIQGALRYEQT